jgi:hypothetical protein
MMARGARAGALLMTVGATVALAGCGSSSHSNSEELRLRRSDLAEVAHALISVRAPLANEVFVAKSVWPLIDRGLPLAPTVARHTRDARAGRAASAAGRIPARLAAGIRRRAAIQARTAAALAQRYRTLRRRLAAVTTLAQQLPDVLVSNADELTGAGSAVSGLYALAAGLLEHSWKEIQATLTAPRNEPRAALAFLRANVDTYIIAVYDSHFDLSVLGKMVRAGFERLGGAKAFADTLTQAQLSEIARAYSPSAARLSPHPWEGLVKQTEAAASP